MYRLLFVPAACLFLWSGHLRAQTPDAIEEVSRFLERSRREQFSWTTVGALVRQCDQIAVWEIIEKDDARGVIRFQPIEILKGKAL